MGNFYRLFKKNDRLTKMVIYRLMIVCIIVNSFSCILQPEKHSCRYQSPEIETLKSCTSPEFVIQTGHLSTINALAIDDHKTIMATASMDGSIKVWDYRKSAELKTFIKHQHKISTIDIDSMGNTILSGGWDKSIALWDVRTGQLKFFKKAHHSNVYAVAISSDGTIGISGSWNGNVKIWDLPTGKKKHSTYAHQKSVTSLAISSDNTLAVSASRDKTIILWDVSSGEILNRFEGHDNEVFSVCFSPDHKYVFSGGRDRQIKCWDTYTGQLIQTLEGHDGIITKLHVTRDNQYLLSACTDNKIRKWDIPSGKTVKTYPVPNNSAFSIDFTKDGNSAIIATNNQFPTYIELDFTSEKIVKQIQRDVHVAYKIAFNSDGSQLITAGPYRPTCVWDLNSGQQLRTINDQKDGIYWLEINTKDNSYISSGADSIIRLINFENGKTLKTFVGHKGAIISVSFDQKGKNAISVGKDQTIRLWDIASGKEIRQFQKKMPRGTVALLHPYEDCMILGSHSRNELVQINTTTGKEILKYKGHRKGISAFVISACGNYLLTGGIDRQLILWDVHSGKKLHSIKIAHDRSVASIAIHPTNSMLVLSGGLKGDIKLWDIEHEKQLALFEGHKSIITALAFHPQKKVFVSACQDGKQILWDMNTTEKNLIFSSFKKDQWLALIPEGFYRASENGNNYLNILYADRTYTSEIFGDYFLQPDLVSSKLSGNVTTAFLVKAQQKILSTIINQ